MIESSLKIEQRLICLLLRHKPLVGDWLESRTKKECFDRCHKVILSAIEDSFDQDVLLTRKSFLTIVNRLTSPQERIKQEISFNECNASYSDKNDFPLLLSQVFDNYLKRESTKDIKSFTDNINKLGVEVSLHELSNSLSNLSNSAVVSGTVVYDDIRSFSEKKIEWIDGVRSGKIKEPPRVLSGISEIDETMGIGFAEGTLTLFCADTGAYKCELGEDSVQLGDGSRIKIKKLYDLINNNKKNLKLLSLNENTQKLFLQTVKAVVDNGEREVYNISTNSGFSINTTKNHRYFTLMGYKYLSDLCEGDYIAIARKQIFGNKKIKKGLPFWLGCMISDGGTSQVGYRFTNCDNDILQEMKKSCENLGGKLLPVGYKKGIIKKNNYYVNSLRKYGKIYEIDEKTSLEKFIPNDVFKWRKKDLVLFLKAMFSCDGSFCARKRGKKKYTNQYSIRYHTSSSRLSEDMRDILLKFGIISSIFSGISYYKKNGKKILKNRYYNVCIEDSPNIIKFIKQIGFCGAKQKTVDCCFNDILSIKSNPNKDIIPFEIWNILDTKFKEYNKSFYGCRRFLSKSTRGHENHCGWKGKNISRKILLRIAKYLNNDEDLIKIANSDIFWDKIKKIDKIGKDRVYDIVMPSFHNFVGNNIIVHNSTMMLNIAMNVWQADYNVLFVPVEMAENRMYDKALSREARVNSEKIVDPTKLTDEERNRLVEAQERWNNFEKKFYILQMPKETKVSYIRKQIEKYITIFKPRLVVIDYIDNLAPDIDRHGRHDLEISDMLQELRRAGQGLGFGVVSGAQLGRDALKRIRTASSSKDQSIIHSEDIRGAHTFSMDSDNIYAQVVNPTQKSLMDIYVVKARYGKRTFSNGQYKATLLVTPEIARIESEEDFEISPGDDDFMNKIFEAEESGDDGDVIWDG